MSTTCASSSCSWTLPEVGSFGFETPDPQPQTRLFEDRIQLRYVRVFRRPVTGQLQLQFHFPIGRGRWRRGQISLWHAEYYVLRDLLRHRPAVRFETCCLPLESPTDLRCEVDGEWRSFADLAFERELQEEADRTSGHEVAQFDLSFAS